MKNSKIAVIIYGAPGSGKGTQAKLLSEKLGLLQFDTGSFLRNIFYGTEKKTKEIIKEKEKYESGKLVDTNWLLKQMVGKVSDLAKMGQSLIFSGSPRTLAEAFGQAAKRGETNTEHAPKTGLLPLLEKFYGKNNIYVFYLNIPEKESIKRNNNRRICSVCKTPLLNPEFNFPHKSVSVPHSSAEQCPFCGGKIERRTDDKKEIIIKRLKEYQENTYPVLAEMKKKKYNVIEIDGTPAPYKIHQKILSYFG